VVRLEAASIPERSPADSKRTHTLHRAPAPARLCGLDHHQVRRWRSWYRWATLTMLASVSLVVTAVTERRWHPDRLGVVELFTCNEVQRPELSARALPPTVARPDQVLAVANCSLRTTSRSSGGLVAGGVWRPCVVVQQARQEPD
jgi:hypothetical protein